MSFSFSSRDIPTQTLSAGRELYGLRKDGTTNCDRVDVVFAPVAVSLAGEAALLRPGRWRRRLYFLLVMLRRVLRRLMIDGFFQRLNLMLMFLGRVARRRLRAFW